MCKCPEVGRNVAYWKDREKLMQPRGGRQRRVAGDELSQEKNVHL